MSHSEDPSTGSTFSDLHLPDRPKKPRSTGLTSIIDNGTPYTHFRSYVEDFHAYLDFVKFGWGTALVTPCLSDKLALLREYEIDFWFGGTLFEAAYIQNLVPLLSDWVESLGCKYFEISDGSIDYSNDAKLEWIADLSSRFHVLSEVGSKDAETVMSPSEWATHISDELNAGAWKVIAEGRESGTAGIYRSTGEVRYGLIKELEQVGVDFERVIFEAPQKAQQVWFIQELGAHVNLGNIAIADIVSLETLRLGLRADTINLLPLR